MAKEKQSPVLDVSVKANSSMTQEVVSMETGSIFAHGGNVYLKLRSDNGGCCTLIKDEGMREVGSGDRKLQLFAITNFNPEEYGRLVTRAQLKIDI